MNFTPRWLASEFIPGAAVQPPVKVAVGKARNSKHKPAVARQMQEDNSFSFSFGSRRYASKGPRRLFVPQKCIVSPAYDPGVERPHAILRLR